MAAVSVPNQRRVLKARSSVVKQDQGLPCSARRSKCAADNLAFNAVHRHLWGCVTVPTVPTATVEPPLRFDRFEISAAERVVRVDGHPAPLGARAFDLLLALAQRRERLVSKQELLDLVWPGVVVEEHNITAQISTLRKLLGARAIATVPGRGYRFTAPLAEGVDAESVPASALVAAAPPGLAQTHLPRELTPLLGRDDDLSALAELVHRYRLVTLVGAGGMGKSLLAKHLLRSQGGDYAHGVCWVELASISDPAELPLRIAQALGVYPGSGEPLTGLCAALSPLTLLVALDNAEHLLTAVAHAAGALLDAAPGLRLIVTSQAPLRLPAERVYRVGPLAVPQGPLPTTLAQTFGAVALFVERARGADARFVLSDTSAPAAIDLCRQLDGLPLAIELAAARAPLLGVQQLAASMQDRLQVLTRNRDAAAPARQQTLRGALEWSHGFLDERERAVFRRLGVMADSASLAFIQQVVADEHGAFDAWAVLDALGTLVDRSLVTVLGDDEHEAHEDRSPRYRLLESPRFFAIEQLRAVGEEEMLQRRHAVALAAVFDSAWDERFSGRIGVQRWVGRILQDASNARDAIAWAQTASEPDVAVALAATLFHALPRSSFVDRMAMGELCESLAEQVASPQLRLRALQVGARPFNHPRHQRSLELTAQAVALARELDRDAPDRWPLYHALSRWIMAAAVVSRPSPDALREAMAELAALEDPRWPPHRRARGLEAVRLARIPLGGPDQPADQLSRTHQWIAALEAEGDDAAPCMGSLVDAQIECGHMDVAVQLGERVLEQLAGSRDEWSRGMVQSNLALAFLMQNDPARARAHLRAVWPLVERWNMHAQAADLPPLMAALEGRPRTAARLAGYSDAACEARDLIRHPLEVTARERSYALARAALGDETFERLLIEGTQLRDEQIAALAFATEDSC